MVPRVGQDALALICYCNNASYSAPQRLRAWPNEAERPAGEERDSKSLPVFQTTQPTVDVCDPFRAPPLAAAPYIGAYLKEEPSRCFPGHTFPDLGMEMVSQRWHATCEFVPV